MEGHKKEVKVEASLWKRTVAFIIDIILLDLFVASPYGNIIRKQLPATYSVFMPFQPSATLLSIGFFIVMQMFLYFTMFEYLLGQTPGKMAFNLYAESEEQKRITFFQSVIRNAFLLPIPFLIILWFVDPLVLLVKQRRLSEIISRTKVIEVVKL